jgi:ABC-type multidrug transport system ATPase subunit/serine/threonine protein kinase
MGRSQEPETPTQATSDSERSTQERPPVAAPGNLVQQRYRIQAVIGEGGFGRVYRAFDERLGREVALKVIQRRGTPEADRLFLEEARTIARLDHPHVVPVYDAGLDREWQWLVMRLIKGKSLGELLRSSGPLPPERARAHLLDLLDALGHAHSRGLVHRDVKPSNILLEARENGEDHIWLADFGVAKAFTLETPLSERVVVGTPHYMAPEQVAGQKVDPRADLFAVGCVACELVTGQRAFDGQSRAEVMFRVVHEPPRSLDQLAARAGPAFARCIKRALAKSPADRPSSAAELRSELQLLDAERGLGDRSIVRSLRGLLSPGGEPHWDGLIAVEAEEVTKSYRFGRPILRRLDLQVPRGSIFAILGNNGSGKTTLLRLVMGLYRADRGRLRVLGRAPERSATSILARVGYVPEVPAVYPGLTVGDTLDFARRFYPNWDTAFCYHLLGRFAVPLSERVRDLSRGLQTKISLLLALAHRPELLVLDDPTLGLDAVVLEEFFETLRDASQREGTTILICSHNLEQLERTVTHIGFLVDGRLRHAGPLASMRERSLRVQLVFSGEAPYLPRIEGFRRLRRSGSEVSGVVVDSTPATLARLEELGATRVDTQTPTLRDLFIGLMSESGQEGPPRTEGQR